MPSRWNKATKIFRLLQLCEEGPPLKVLEVGTGSGAVASYFAGLAARETEVHAVDVTDSRQVRDNFSFCLVAGTELPFPDHSFDVVISNHVIEHVGDRAEQRNHLDEIRRVITDDGLVYLAVPNRWQLIEPHYRLAFLSWLPERFRSRYLRFFRDAEHYDCRPLSVQELETLLEDAGFHAEQQTGEAVHATFQIEAPQSVLYQWMLKHLPPGTYRAVRRLFPTLIYIGRPDPSGPCASV